ncbi:hypothetical protein QUF70_08270 [Desulfobacterales bacterium HSG17]|nr:hypothetical protein [Desulfobacterales bacterium HSG17]
MIVANWETRQGSSVPERLFPLILMLADAVVESVLSEISYTKISDALSPSLRLS